jgi:hypothetical protein
MLSLYDVATFHFPEEGLTEDLTRAVIQSKEFQLYEPTYLAYVADDYEH